MKEQIKRTTFFSFILHMLPGSISIIQVESLNVFMFTHSPIKSSNLYLLLWVLFQSGVGVIYAKISDKKHRKTVLVTVQIAGVFVCASLWSAGDSWLIPLILVGAFNPLPVAKATLLDNFPQYSPLRIIALTYLFQYFPWSMFNYINSVNVSLFINFQIGILLVNSVLTYFFVKDNYSIGHRLSQHPSLKGKPKAIGVLVAFMFAEMSFFLIWAVLEHNTKLGIWFAPTTIGTLLGISFVMAYSKITHISIITLSYLGCFGAMILAVYLFYAMGSNGSISAISMIASSSLFGGLFLPFVTDAIILHYGGKRKAFAASIVELFDSIAQGVGTSIPLLAVAIGLEKLASIPIVFFVMALFFLISFLIQKFVVRDVN